MNSAKIRTQDYSELQNRIVNISIIIFSIFLTMAHIGTTIRALNYKLDIPYYIQSFDLLVLLLLTLFRKHLNFKIKAYVIILITFSVIFASLLSVGFLASSKLYIIVIPIYLYFVLSYRKAIFTFILYILLFILFGYLYVGGFLDYNFNLNDYLSKPVVWVIESINIIALSLGILIVIHYYSKSLMENYKEIQSKNEELHKNEEKYRAQYNYYPLPVYTIKKNSEGKFIFIDINKAARNYEFANAEMIIGEDINKFLNSDYENKIIQIIEKVLNIKKSDSIDILYKHKSSNKERFLNLTFGYIPPEIILMTVKDITDEKNTQIALIESEKAFQALLNATTESAILCKPDGTILKINEVGANRYNSTINDITGEKLHDYFPVLDEKIQKEILKKAQKEHKPVSFETERDGKIYENSIYIILNTKKEIDAYAIYSKDITDKKKVENDLKQSEETYRAQYNYFPIPVLTIKRKDGELVFDNFNEATKDYPYIESGLLKNRMLKEFFKQESEKRFIDIINSIFISKETQTIEVEYLFKTTGEKRILNVVCGFVPPDSVLLTLIDITDKKKTQEKLVYAMMNAEERERGRVAKELHDGVSPVLAAIKLYIQSFLAAKDESLRKELSLKIFNTIQETIRSVSDISNKLSPHILQNFGLKTAVQNFIDKVKDTSGINFSYIHNVKSKMNEKVEVNLYRVIVELINNTIKYADAEHISVELIEEAANLRMSFEHNGKGFNLDKVLASSNGMGLNNLFNRIHVLNGTIEYNTSEESNLKVNIIIPLL